MGATQLERKPATKREERAVQTIARLGVNKSSVILVIPATSPLYSRFVVGGVPKSYWSFELRTNNDLKGEPYFAVMEKGEPKNRRQGGIAAGSVNKETKAFSLAILRSQFKLLDRFGEFSSQKIELYADNGGEILFKLPANRKPLAGRGEAPPVAVVPAPAEIKPPAPSHEREVVGRIARASDVPVPAPEPKAGDVIQMIYTPPKEKISLERAINIINTYRERMGDDLVLTVTKEGKLQAMAKFGAD
jgi:hypothetical protein